MQYSPEYKKQVVGLVDETIKLAEKLEERIALEKIAQQINRIISASRIEGNDKVASFAVSLSGLIVALEAGRLFPEESTRLLFVESLNQIRQDAGNDGTGIEPALMNRLKSLLTAANTFEKDYVFSRKINVMYVDDDFFVYSNVQKIAGNSMNITLAPRASEARQSAMQQKYDAIICEMDLPDASGLELIKEFASRYPVVAISTLDDPRRVQLATKAGAADFIVKNEVGIRMIPRSLHTAVNEWEKKRRGSKKDDILSDPRSAKILNYLIGGFAIEQDVKPATFYKMQTLEPEKTLSSTLAALEQAGYIVKNTKKLALSCPRCHSLNLISNYYCSHCSKSNFVRGDVIEHNKCGHNDLEFAFQKDDTSERLFCPKCNKELKLIGVDYRRTETAYKCKECRNVFVTPEQKYACSDCSASFKLSEGGWMPMYEYTINPSKMAELQQRTTSMVPVEEYLTSKGFAVELDGSVETRVEEFGPFELVARRKDRILVIITLGDDIEANHSKIMDLDTMSRTVASSVSSYVVTFTDLREVTRELLGKFGFTIINIKNSEHLLNRIKEYV